MQLEHDPEDWEGNLPPPRNPNIITRWKGFVLRHWNPEPLPSPTPDPELEHLSAVERSAEVMRYSFLSLEFWISPLGFMREWLRFNAKVALFLSIPSLLVVPIITFALGQFQTWASLIALTTTNMLLFPLSALLLVGLISGLFYIGKTILIMRASRNRREQQYYRDGY